MPKETEPGLAVDNKGGPVIDPTANVLQLVEAAMKRQDDLRRAEALRQDQLRETESRYIREMADLRAAYQAELRKAESARIDAIRAVDVGAVNRAAEVASTQAAALAASLAATAEAARTQVAAAASAAVTSLAASLEPIIRDIQDLRKTQYEQAGAGKQTGESRAGLGTIISVISLLGVLILGILTLVNR